MLPLREVLSGDGQCDGLDLASGDVAFASDRSLRIVCWSRGAEELLGQKAEEVLGTPCSAVMRCTVGDLPPPCHGYFVSTLRGVAMEPVPPFEHVVRGRDGVAIPVAVTSLLVTARAKRQHILVHFLRALSREKEMERLLTQVASAAAQLCPELGASLSASAAAPAQGSGSAVTQRELEVIRLLAEGATTGTIAGSLGISRHTARNHIQNVLAKLRVHSRLEAVARARARRLL